MAREAWDTKAEDTLVLHVAPLVYWTRVSAGGGLGVGRKKLCCKPCLEFLLFASGKRYCHLHVVPLLCQMKVRMLGGGCGGRKLPVTGR